MASRRSAPSLSTLPSLNEMPAAPFENPEPPVALTIAGSDCSAGAGLQADLKTFSAHGVFGLTVVTSVVAEIPGKVVAVECVTPELVIQQIEVLANAYPLGSIKTGMLANRAIVEAVADTLRRSASNIPLVVDPVMIASSGDRLLEEDAIVSYREQLLPLAALITPNLNEAVELFGQPIETEAAMAKAAQVLAETYQTSVLLKGGHLSGEEVVDLLWDGAEMHRFAAPRVENVETHGTGCTLSATIAAGLANGLSLPEAVGGAKRYITAAISQSLGWRNPGQAGINALNHFPPGLD